MKAGKCNATCFSLFLDVGMAYILGALESPNNGAQKCIGKWLRENDSFKKYRTFCILFAIIGSFCFVLPHSCLQSMLGGGRTAPRPHPNPARARRKCGKVSNFTIRCVLLMLNTRLNTTLTNIIILKYSKNYRGKSDCTKISCNRNTMY